MSITFDVYEILLYNQSGVCFDEETGEETGASNEKQVESETNV